MTMAEAMYVLVAAASLLLALLVVVSPPSWVHGRIGGWRGLMYPKVLVEN